MEKRTIYIHKSKDDSMSNNKDQEHRIVTFIGGNKDIVSIIKDLIKDKYQA